jgi:membrane-bound lytic murein transglycosylase B
VIIVIAAIAVLVLGTLALFGRPGDGSADGTSTVFANPVVAPAAAPAPEVAAAPAPGVAGQVDEAWAQRVSDATGIPPLAVIAYAGGSLGSEDNVPGCGLGWNTIAAIGLVESDHGTHDGSAIGPTGAVAPPIYGVALDGDGVALIADSDGGQLDGDADHDRAMGPMQIIPDTWRSWMIDGNGDGIGDPQNIFDAALSAGNYLCHASGGMSTSDGWMSGIAAYNAGGDYLRKVAETAQYYADAAASVSR